MRILLGQLCFTCRPNVLPPVSAF